LLYFTLFLLASFYQKTQKKLESLVVVISLLLVIMLFPKYVLEDLSVGSGSIIEKDNIEEFFNHISMHKEVEEKSLVELAPSYEVAFAYLVHMLEARFASLNPFLQYMFLKLNEIEDTEKKAFILETLRIEFRDIAIEARKVFKKFNKLGSPVAVVGTSNKDFRVPISYKLAGIHDVLENNTSWICPENPLDESSVPKRDHKGSSKTYVDTIPFIFEKTPIVDPNASFIIT
jgi:hypothetical protein